MATAVPLADKTASLFRETGNMTAVGLEATRKVISRPWPFAEFLDQLWFLAKVTTLPVILISIPFGMVISLQVGALVKQLGAEAHLGSALVLAVVREQAPTATALMIAGPPLGGHAQVTGGGPAAVYSHVKSGKLRAIASWGVKAHPALPEVPTLKSMGYDIEAYLWVGTFTTAGVPDATFKKMRELMGKVTSDPAFKKALENVHIVPDYRDTPEFKKFFDEDYKRMAAAIKKIGKL
jgi:hypothetical protein